MKLNFLGTAAAEGFPAIFCNCEYCKEARKLGGKNIRSRSQTLINDDLLIDLPADSYWHFINNGIEGDKIKYLLITHSHPDHLYPSELKMRHGAFARNMRIPELKAFCGEGAYKKITTEFSACEGIEVNLVKPFETFTVGEYEITPLPARHFAGDGAVFYIIKGEKTLLYGHDTGYFYDEVFEYIEKEKIYFDMISLDCTNVGLPAGDDGGHMGFENIGRLTKRLEDIKAVDGKTVKYVNHFSHNGNPIHSILEKRAAEIGFKPSFDGLKVEF